MARDDVAHRVHAWIQRKNTQEVCRRNQKKEEVEKHIVQAQNTES
jgi:hypothetical protein